MKYYCTCPVKDCCRFKDGLCTDRIFRFTTDSVVKESIECHYSKSEVLMALEKLQGKDTKNPIQFLHKIV